MRENHAEQARLRVVASAAWAAARRRAARASWLSAWAVLALACGDDGLVESVADAGSEAQLEAPGEDASSGGPQGDSSAPGASLLDIDVPGAPGEPDGDGAPDRPGANDPDGGDQQAPDEQAGDGDDSPGSTPAPSLPKPTLPKPADGGPTAGFAGGCAVPSEAGAEDSSKPNRVIGKGTPQSCTADAFIAAVAAGGVITFDCGPAPVTITLDRPAKIFNNTGPKIVIDGKGLVTLSGGGKTRILYMNTCDEKQVWTTASCQNQDHPRLTVQNLTFVDGNSAGDAQNGGGGAIWVRGGRFKVVNSRFFRNACVDKGPDVGGGAVTVFSQYDGQPVYVVNSTFGGASGYGNQGANGGALSSIGVSWSLVNSLLSYNKAAGQGGNPAQAGTPGGGSGGAIYNDGNEMTLSLCGVKMEQNRANAYGSAIFFVSNNHTGKIVVRDSLITQNQGGSWYPTYPQISNHDDTPISVTRSTIE
jgi:hypothetical protein